MAPLARNLSHLIRRFDNILTKTKIFWKHESQIITIFLSKNVNLVTYSSCWDKKVRQQHNKKIQNFQSLLYTVDQNWLPYNTFYISEVSVKNCVSCVSRGLVNFWLDSLAGAHCRNCGIKMYPLFRFSDSYSVIRWQ